MSSVQAVPFTRQQYGSFRATNTAGIPKSPIVGGLYRGLIAQVPNASTKISRSQPEVTRQVATPKICRKVSATANTLGTKKIGLNSPLQSPQIIRSTRIENNWNKKLTTSNFCSLHSKSPGSSGTSVESIVPKYKNSLITSNTSTINNINGALRTSIGSSHDSNNNNNQGSQKRAYNINKSVNNRVASKIVNNSRSSGIVSQKVVTKKLYKDTNGNTVTNSNTINSNNNNNKKDVTTTPTTTNAANASSYSSKFPNGLPFEDEFYRPRRSLSEESTHSDSSETLSLMYGDEFSRKPSNEALYVDFTKALNASSPHSSNSNSSIMDNDYFYKFESVSNGIFGGGRLKKKSSTSSISSSSCINHNHHNNMKNTKNEQEKPLMYVAMASWVPKCNRLPYETSILEPTDEKVE